MVRALTMIDTATTASKLGASRITTSIHGEYPKQYPRQCATYATMEVNLKRYFKTLVSDLGIEYKYITVRKPTSSGILKGVHGTNRHVMDKWFLHNFTFDPGDPWGRHLPFCLGVAFANSQYA